MTDLAVLTREIHVRVLNCSPSGCLFECSGSIEVGTTASLRIMWEDRELTDELRVVRCQPVAGSSSYLVGGEFSWTAPSGSSSLRLGFPRL